MNTCHLRFHWLAEGLGLLLGLTALVVAGCAGFGEAGTAPTEYASRAPSAVVCEQAFAVTSLAGREAVGYGEPGARFGASPRHRGTGDRACGLRPLVARG